MAKQINILLQTTIPAIEDDWHIGRFSLLAQQLRSITDEQGRSAFNVEARNREVEQSGNDSILSRLDKSDFDELWLFAVDPGNGLSGEDCSGITRFRQRGGGILATRDHQDLGSSICTLGGIGAAHFFHSRNLDPDESTHVEDNQDNKSISWPNYNSGKNGDYQRIRALSPVHPLLRRSSSPDGVIRVFPAHPHEGGVGVPSGEEHARVLATGNSVATGRPFNLMVAFENAMDERDNTLGRAVAESSFHHFVDYNWDLTLGCPSFVEDPPGGEIVRDPSGLEDVKTYVRNLAFWLSPKSNEG